MLELWYHVDSSCGLENRVVQFSLECSGGGVSSWHMEYLVGLGGGWDEVILSATTARGGTSVEYSGLRISSGSHLLDLFLFNLIG